MNLGAEVRRRRKALGLTLDDLAERSGLSPHYLSTLENGHRDPHLSTIMAVAKALRVPPAELFAGVDSSEPAGVGPLFERAPAEAQAAISTLLRLIASPVRKRRGPRRKKR